MGQQRRLIAQLRANGVRESDLKVAADALELLYAAGDDMSDSLWIWLDSHAPDGDREESRRIAVQSCRAGIVFLNEAVDIIENLQLEENDAG